MSSFSTLRGHDRGSLVEQSMPTAPGEAWPLAMLADIFANCCSRLGSLMVESRKAAGENGLDAGAASLAAWSDAVLQVPEHSLYQEHVARLRRPFGVLSAGVSVQRMDDEIAHRLFECFTGLLKAAPLNFDYVQSYLEAVRQTFPSAEAYLLHAAERDRCIVAASQTGVLRFTSTAHELISSIDTESIPSELEAEVSVDLLILEAVGPGGFEHDCHERIRQESRMRIMVHEYICSRAFPAGSGRE